MRRPIAPLTIVLVVGALLSPAVGATAQEGDPRAELEVARTELDGAERSLAVVDDQLAVARGELDAADGRLAAATAELRRVEQDLVAAEATLAEAGTVAAEQAAVLDVAARELDAAREARTAAVTDLEDRVRASYKQSHVGVALEGLVRSRDLHQLNTTWRAMQTMAGDDVRRIESARVASLAEAEQRADVADVTREARRAEAAALAARRDVELLLRSQTSLVTSIEADRAARAAALATIEQDRVVSARLVEQLDERVQALAASLADALVAADPDARLDGPMPTWASVLPSHGQRLAPAVAGAAARVGIDGRLFAALVWSESNFQPSARSHAGALGLTQLMPGTAAGLGVDPLDPFANLDGGARYLRAQLGRFGSAELALAAYNAGPGAVEKYGRTIPPYAETQAYVLTVLERFDRLVAAS